MSIIELSGVKRSFGQKEALKGVDLVVDEPQVLGLIGRNGAGKSTLLRMLPPLLHATEGEVKVFGQDPWQHQETLRQRLGYLSDNDSQPGHLRPNDLFDLCAHVYGQWDKDLVNKYCERFAIDRKQNVGQMSKGQKRQVGLLCAICHRPELVILDEPAGGLDPVVRRDLLQALVELLAESGSTVLFSSHLFGDVSRLAQRLVIVHDGQVLVDDAIESLLGAYSRVVLADAVSAADFVDGQTCIAQRLVGQDVELLVAAPVNEAAAVLLSLHPTLTAEQVSDVEELGLEDLFIALTKDAAA